MSEGPDKDWVQEWVDEHPGTIFYIALIATASFLLQVYQAVSS